MTENIPTEAGIAHSGMQISKKQTRKQKYDKTRLPTPPPDPLASKDNKGKDVLEYLETIIPNYSRSTSSFAPVVATEEAFDHLEKLYKLMEQMLELREQNAKLHRRIRDLEYFNNLGKMQKQLDTSGGGKECPELDCDTAFAETILESILADSTRKDQKQKALTPTKLRPSILRKQRNRSGSTTTEKQVTLEETVTVQGDTSFVNHEKSAKVSKWTKVKAAFKWEKASTAVGDNKAQDVGIHVPVNVEIARYLRVPSTSDDTGHSPADSGAAGISTPGSVSTTSSIEDFHRSGLQTPYEDFRSSEDEHSQHNYILHSKDDHSSAKTSPRMHKTPWAKMKGIIPTRNSFKKKHRLSAASDDIQIDIEPCSDEEVFEDENRNKFIEIPENENVSTNCVEVTPPEIPQEVIKRYQRALAENFNKDTSKWTIVKEAFLTKGTQPSSHPSSPKEFKKKLQEWEKIKKSSGKESSGVKKKLREVGRWKSLSGHRPETSTAVCEYPQLSEEFRKKLDEWKQIKAAGTGISTLIAGQEKQEAKDLYWVEKELYKIEKEKQRLERERQKFLEREERLSKLHKAGIGSNKKEVLIHTPSGFYKFEGISRKFTQKLYEWEKAKGIAPEESTFALLSSSYAPETKPVIKRHSDSPSLVRSMSADSIATSALNLTCPLMTHQPSSLSLNDVEELEKECLADSKSSSINFLLESQENLDIDEPEPEAVLVEVEDYEEETAAPLRTYIEREQLPIYQRQEIKALCEGETVSAPKVRRSESARAQANYNLIEDITNLLKQLTDNENEIKNLNKDTQKSHQNPDILEKLKFFYEKQHQLCNELKSKVTNLQEANSSVVVVIYNEMGDCQNNLNETLEAIQDLSNEVFQTVEKLDQYLANRIIENTSTSCKSYLLIYDIIRDIRSKALELRRHLSYVCATTDLTAPRNLNGKNKTLLQKTISNESKSSPYDTSDVSRRGSQKEEQRYIKSENISSNSTHSQGAVKKRIKYRQKVMQNRSLPDSDDDEDENKQMRNNRQHKKLTRARTTHESTATPITKSELDEHLAETIIVPTETNYMNALKEETSFPPDSPLTVFVKTTRKLFIPIGERGLAETNKSLTRDSDVLAGTESSATKETISENNDSVAVVDKSTSSAIPTNVKVLLPPLPPSPVPQRKILRDISPSIRLMLAKYNQKINETETTNVKSGNSSGSNSPIAWRSPSLERRVKAQTEKYQEELIKMSPLLGGRREVQKSASVSYISSESKQVTVPVRRESVQENLLSSLCEANAINETGQEKIEDSPQYHKNPLRKLLTLNISPNNNTDTSKHSPEVRFKKLQKAKEEFLKSTPMSAPPQLTTNEDIVKFPTRNRLSQISVDSESSFDSSLPGALMKSASVGMINVDPDTYRQIDPELQGRAYVSLPRNTSNLKSNKFGLSSIASKFRKVKMRRGKERDKNKDSMNTISTLCRHSLVVDITKHSGDEGTAENEENDGISLAASGSDTMNKDDNLHTKKRRLSVLHKYSKK
ncbi:hypothetical protein NQ315_002733 [Exocentrus adspersus]|uniref:Uncharacterized protein n=1 Tax=Exocentrus adspersus TaxID=1586481 RepID=A0AAV8V8B4_9CUCU|nr:hypothetical protein NQ315_002733 [Exocentrus adspersus]